MLVKLVSPGVVLVTQLTGHIRGEYGARAPDPATCHESSGEYRRSTPRRPRRVIYSIRYVDRRGLLAAVDVDVGIDRVALDLDAVL